MDTAPVKRSEKRIAANIFKGSLGNMIEWFDWYVYASFAVYFSAAFFPAEDKTAELLSTLPCLPSVFDAAAWVVCDGPVCGSAGA